MWGWLGLRSTCQFPPGHRLVEEVREMATFTIARGSRLGCEEHSQLKLLASGTSVVVVPPWSGRTTFPILWLSHLGFTTEHSCVSTHHPEPCEFTVGAPAGRYRAVGGHCG